jgi:hypothetical protein
MSHNDVAWTTLSSEPQYLAERRVERVEKSSQSENIFEGRNKERKERD